MDLVTNNDSSEDDMDFENCTDLPLPEPSQTTENCFVHLPKLEEQFYRCFGLEIFTVSRNLGLVSSAFAALIKSYFGLFHGTPAMREGTVMEPQIREWFQKTAGSFSSVLDPSF